MKKDKRINVRANSEMLDKLGAIRCYLNCISDSETLDVILEYIFTSNFKEIKAFYDKEYKISHSKN